MSVTFNCRDLCFYGEYIDFGYCRYLAPVNASSEIPALKNEEKKNSLPQIEKKKKQNKNECLNTTLYALIPWSHYLEFTFPTIINEGHMHWSVYKALTCDVTDSTVTLHVRLQASHVVVVSTIIRIIECGPWILHYDALSLLTGRLRFHSRRFAVNTVILHPLHFYVQVRWCTNSCDYYYFCQKIKVMCLNANTSRIKHNILPTAKNRQSDETAVGVWKKRNNFMRNCCPISTYKL